MQRSYHVWKSYPAKEQWKGGTTSYVVSSFDTYEQAKVCAIGVYTACKAGEKVEVAHMGSLVWGPYIVGSKYTP